MEEQEQEKDDYTWTIIAGVIYVGLLIYFGWQTWEFVSWLFPQDQLAMKCLSLLSFDIMALLWACIDLFDRKRNEPHKPMVLWAWGLSFALSLLASILYLVIANMLRFDVPVTAELVDTGEAITIFALTVNILFLTFWIYGKLDSRKGNTPQKRRVTTQPTSTPMPQPATQPAQQPAKSPSQPAQSSGIDMAALLAAMQKMANDAAQSAANTATQQMIAKLTIPVQPTTAAPPAQPSGPNTEQLAPFTAAPSTMKGANGAKQN